MVLSIRNSSNNLYMQAESSILLFFSMCTPPLPSISTMAFMCQLVLHHQDDPELSTFILVVGGPLRLLIDPSLHLKDVNPGRILFQKLLALKSCKILQTVSGIETRSPPRRHSLAQHHQHLASILEISSQLGLRWMSFVPLKILNHVWGLLSSAKPSHSPLQVRRCFSFLTAM